MIRQRSRNISALFFFASLFYPRSARAVDDWLPISPDELKMTSEPRAPGASAIILYRQIDREDSTLPVHEYNYVRIKIFTDEGRRYADLEIPFFAGTGKIYNIRARTIHSDGTIVDFDGRVLEKEIVKTRGFKYLAKIFTLSDVQPGSIIEYRYTSDQTFGSTHWILSQDLFTKLARFSFKRYPLVFALQTSWPNGLPEGSTVPAKDGGTIRLESRNIPAFQVEEDMPPEDAMRYKVDFIYTDPTLPGDPQNFWKAVGLRWHDQVEGFLAKRKAVEESLPQIVSTTDTPETKLQKIYARVQQIRNTSYEREKTAQEQKRAKEKEIKSVDDLWKQGRGDFVQINWTFLALVRAAGFEAYPVLVASRNENFFNPKYLKASDLSSNAVLVKVGGKDLYLDPGTIFTSYGLLPWGETGVQALKIDKDGGTWVNTPLFDSTISQISRSAELKLTSDGSLEGKLTITYSGHEAAWRRFVERHEDENQRKKFLEDEVKASIPVTVEIDSVDKPDWTTSAPSLVAHFNLKVPSWLSAAGRRSLLPVGLFSLSEKHTCEHPTRVHPLYFAWKFQKMDDIRIELAPDWQVSSLPAPRSTRSDLVAYTLNLESDKAALRVTRLLKSDIISLDADKYETLRGFYQAVRTGDEQQIVLQPAGTIAGDNSD